MNLSEGPGTLHAMPGSSDRTARLDALVKLVGQWSDLRINQIALTVASQKKMLAARGSPAHSAFEVANTVVVTALKEFTG